MIALNGRPAHYYILKIILRKAISLLQLCRKKLQKQAEMILAYGSDKKDLWVLQATQMPAILIETGFIANYDDERYLNSEKGQQEIAEAITRALIRYRNQVENPKASNANAAGSKRYKIVYLFILPNIF